MSNTIKYQPSKKKGKIPKLEKGTKSTLRVKYLKEIEDEYKET